MAVNVAGKRDITQAQAEIWIAREAGSITDYEDLLDRIEAEKRLLEDNPGKAQAFPVSARARAEFIERLEGIRARMRARFH